MSVVSAAGQTNVIAGNSKDDADFRFSDERRSSLECDSDDVGRRQGVGSAAQAAALSPRSREYLRLRVNARERQRMHDMNLALDALRRAMPYAQGPAVKKLSKMNTLLLARNYILLLTRTLDELRRLLLATSGGAGGGELPALSSKRHGHPDVDALRTFVVRDLHAEHQRYAEELIRREQQQQQGAVIMTGQEGREIPAWNCPNPSHNSVTSSSSPESPPRRKRRAGTASPPPPAARAPLLPTDNKTDDPRPPTVMTSSSAAQIPEVESSAVMGHLLATQFACPCRHCRDSKPTYIIPLDFVATTQLHHRSTAQI